ncbi:MAG: hypothetical protein ACYTF7_01615 [Planctomycetota bacterium]|jgi:hypothetical protein
MDSHKNTRRTRTVNIALVVVALMLGIDIGSRMGGNGMISSADAQAGAGVVNPADQRRQIVKELQAMNRKITELNANVSKTFGKGPVDVSVVDFPKNVLVSD